MASCTLISRFVITLGIVCGVCDVLLKVEVRWLMIAVYIGIDVCSFLMMFLCLGLVQMWLA